MAHFIEYWTKYFIQMFTMRTIEYGHYITLALSDKQHLIYLAAFASTLLDTAKILTSILTP